MRAVVEWISSVGSFAFSPGLVVLTLSMYDYCILYRSISDNFIDQYVANKWINFWVIFPAWMNWPMGTVHWSPVTARRILDFCMDLFAKFSRPETDIDNTVKLYIWNVIQFGF